MIPYLLMLVFVIFLCRKIEAVKATNPKQANILKWWLIAFLTSFIGFRYAVGADYFAYIWDYRKWLPLTYEEILTGKEPVIRLIVKLCNLIYPYSETNFFVVMAFIFVAPAVCTIYKYSHDFTKAMVLFIICGCYLDACNASRQCMAVGLIFANYDNIRQQRLVRYILVTIAAALCHASAITMLPLYFIFSPRIKLHVQLLLMACTMGMLCLSFSDLMTTTGDILGKELDQDVEYFNTAVNIFRILVYCAPCALLFMSKRLGDRLPDYAVFLAFNALLAVGTSRSAYLMRVCIYTNIFTPLAIPEAVSHVKGLQTTFLWTACFVSFFAYWIYGILQSAGLFPYQCVFFPDEAAAF